VDGTREELIATYRRPYRRRLPRLYALNRVGPALAVAGALALLAGVLEVAAEGAPGGLVALAAVAAVLAVLWALWVTAAGAWVIRARTREWRARHDSELARVRAGRPHAGEADRRFAHDEFAVSVEDGGRLVTWRFTPLAAHERPAVGDRLLVGMPRYAAREVASAPHDASDAALAAEQLAAAQEDAAALERAAAEAASTGRALRAVTGQSRR
jgi:hypothetical protein